MSQFQLRWVNVQKEGSNQFIDVRNNFLILSALTNGGLFFTDVPNIVTDTNKKYIDLMVTDADFYTRLNCLFSISCDNNVLRSGITNVNIGFTRLLIIELYK